MNQAANSSMKYPSDFEDTSTMFQLPDCNHQSFHIISSFPSPGPAQAMQTPTRVTPETNYQVLSGEQLAWANHSWHS